jgi:hypothetical protein
MQAPAAAPISSSQSQRITRLYRAARATRSAPPDGWFLCACGKRTHVFTSGQEYSPAGLGSYRLPRRQVLKDQGILGRYEVAERHLIKR